MSTGTFSDEQRHFLATVSKTVFTNPFDEQLAADIKQLAPAFKPHKQAHSHYFNALVPQLEQLLAKLDQQGFNTLSNFQDNDRRLIADAYLFQVYHRYLDELDDLICVQSTDDQPVPVACAEPIISMLKTRGFNDSECLRYLALFYQIRRAYYFIVHSLIGSSRSMQQLRLHLWNSVFTYDIRLYDKHLWNKMEDFSTLLLGETGVGKGAAAAAIGRSAFIPFNRRKNAFAESFKPNFVAINLSQFPENLIESELFGHRKGAFTGAMDHHKGVLERCSKHGALFLDEIGDVSIPIQIKLLQVLQERSFSPVGSHEQKRFRGRIIAATHRPLDELRKQEKFRHDFFYRLCTNIITVPPLHQRLQETKQELPQLVSLLIKRITGQNSEQLGEQVLQTIESTLPADYPWPGNVRELEQAIRRIILSQQYPGDMLQCKDDREQLNQLLLQGDISARELLGRYCRLLYDKYGNYERVAEIAELDRRTVKKYVTESRSS